MKVRFWGMRFVLQYDFGVQPILDFCLITYVVVDVLAAIVNKFD